MSERERINNKYVKQSGLSQFVLANLHTESDYEENGGKRVTETEKQRDADRERERQRELKRERQSTNT